ncbi:MAG: LysR family transcriptional regulator [Pseudomonadota bacterium]|nr:LysR family transcriptional regulator [Pseudomonadota bacterium]
MIPSATELRYFIEVAQTENLSRAAERLGVSQPTLTLAIKRLEDSLGHIVLLRSKTGVKLTKPGVKLLAQARFLLDEWEKIRNSALEDELELRGLFSIGVHQSVANYTLFKFLPALVSEFPYLEFKLVHKLSRLVTEEVISGKVDFGLVVNPVAHPDLVIKNLLTDEVTFWMSEKIKKNWENLPLICDPELLQTQALLKQIQKKGISFSRRIESSSLEVINKLVAFGAGVGIIPGRVAACEESEKLVKVSPQWPVFQDRICLIFRADSQRSTASKKIVQSILSMN